MKKITICCYLLAILAYTIEAAAKQDFIEAKLIIKNHYFFPETLELPSGKKIRLIVENQDSTIEEFESFDLKREKIVRGNSQIRVILAPLKPGEYAFFGDFHEETAKGKIIVKEE